jgi:catechol 2,3-dioxygenase-like lactoylglutathione lyase family enzyme
MDDVAARGGWPAHLPVRVLRVVRWSRNYHRTVRFYRDIVGLPELDDFAGSYGLDGTILGLPAVSVHLEIVRLGDGEDAAPTTGLDELVLYLPDAAAQRGVVTRLAAAGIHPVPPIPYWADNEGVTFTDPDGHHLIITSWVYRPS